MVKIAWKHHGIEEATWETEEKMRRDYPHLFSDSGNAILRTKCILGGENCNILVLETLDTIHACIHNA